MALLPRMTPSTPRCVKPSREDRAQGVVVLQVTGRIPEDLRGL